MKQQFSLFLGGALCFLAVACLDLNETTFIDLQSNFIPSQTIIQLGDSITFSQLSTEVAQNFSWDFGDSTASTERSPIHVYQSIGKYNVSLVVTKTDGITQDSTVREILVLPSTDTLSNTRTFGSAIDEDIGFAIAKTASGFVLVGRRNLNSMRVLFTDNNFNITDSSNIDNLADGRGRLEVENVLVSEQDAGILVVGFFEYNQFERDSFIIKLDQNGNSLWTQIINTERDERYSQVLELGTNFIATGTVAEVDQNGNQVPGILLDEFDNTGLQIESSVLGSNWTLQDADFTLDGGFILAVTEGNRPRIFRTDAALTELRRFEPRINNASFTGTANAIHELEQGGFILAGSVASDNPDSSNAFVAQFDEQGNQQWIGFEVYFHEEFLDIEESSTGDIFVVGTHENPLTGKDILVSKYNSMGVLQRTRLIGGRMDDNGAAIEIDDSNMIHIIGTTQSFGAGLRDIYVVSLTENLD